MSEASSCSKQQPQDENSPVADRMVACHRKGYRQPSPT